MNNTEALTNHRRLGVLIAGIALASAAIAGAVVSSSHDSAAAQQDEYVALPGYASFGVPRSPVERTTDRRDEVDAQLQRRIARANAELAEALGRTRPNFAP